MNFDWVSSLSFEALDSGRARSLDAAIDEADRLGDAAIVNVRRQLVSSGSQPSIEQLFGRLAEVRRAKVMADEFRDFREALAKAGKLGG